MPRNNTSAHGRGDLPTGPLAPSNGGVAARWQRAATAARVAAAAAAVDVCIDPDQLILQPQQPQQQEDAEAPGRLPARLGTMTRGSMSPRSVARGSVSRGSIARSSRAASSVGQVVAPDGTPMVLVEEAPLPALGRRMLNMLPKTSSVVKSAPRIVQAQAFFKLSFVQWESDSLSFSEAVEEARLTAQNSASSSALDRMSFASGPSSALTVSGNSYIFPALASLNVDDSDRRARGGLWRRLMRALRGGGGAGEGGRGRVRPSNKQRGPAGGSRLYVDVRMEPTVGNFLRVMLLDPVHPNSMFKVLWDFFFMLVDAWICVISPLLLVYVVDIRVHKPWGGAEFFIDVMCWLDVLMYFRTAVITPDFRVRSTHRLIARSYLRSWALLDMAAGLPFLTLINIKGPPLSRRVLLFRLSRLTKLLRLPHAIKTTNVQVYLEAKVFTQKGQVPVLVLLTAVVIVVHYAGLFFYFIGVVATRDTMEGPDSWVAAEELAGFSAGGRYMISIYWAVYTFFTVGYGDITISSVAEKLWCIVMAITGIVMVGWFMGALSAYLGATTSVEAKVSQRRQDLFQFVRTRRLRGDVAKRVQRYYAAVDWRGLSEEDKDVINGLPSMLRTEVVLCLFNGVVSRVPWLEPRPPQFLVDLLLRLQVQVYEQGDVVTTQGEVEGALYFLTEGLLEVRREHEPTDPKHGPHIKRLRPQAPPRRRHHSSAPRVHIHSKPGATVSNDREEEEEDKDENKGGTRSGVAGAVQALLHGTLGRLRGASSHPDAVGHDQRQGQGGGSGSVREEGQVQSQEYRQGSGQGQLGQGQGHGQVHGQGQELLAAGGSCSLDSEAAGSGGGTIELVVGCNAGCAAAGAAPSAPASCASACANGAAGPPPAMPTTANPLFQHEPHPPVPAPGPACLSGHQQQFDQQRVQPAAHELESQGNGLHEHHPANGTAGGQDGGTALLDTGTCEPRGSSGTRQQQQQQRSQEHDPQQELVQEEGFGDGQGCGARVAVSILLDEERCSDRRSAGVANSRRVVIGGEEVMDPGEGEDRPSHNGAGSDVGSAGVSEQERGPDPLGALLRLALGPGREEEGEERGSRGTGRCGEAGEGRGGGGGAGRQSHRRRPPSRYVQLGFLKPGSHFGLTSCLEELPRRNSVVALQHSEVYCLARADLDELRQRWPDIWDDPALEPEAARRNSVCLSRDPLPGQQRQQQEMGQQGQEQEQQEQEQEEEREEDDEQEHQKEAGGG